MFAVAAIAIGSSAVPSGSLSASLDYGKDALAALGKRIPGTAALGEKNLPALWSGRTPDLLALIVVAALIAALVVIWIRAPKPEIAPLAVVIVGGWALALWPMSEPGATVAMLLWPGAVARYFLVPRACLYLSLVLSFPKSALQIAATVIACAILAVGIVSDYRIATPDPVDWSQFSSCMEKAVTPSCSVAIPPGWTLEVAPTGH